MRTKTAFVLGCFAILMMHLGPLISGGQALFSPAPGHAWQQQADTAVTDHLQAHHEHSDHRQHALMGHAHNPALPEWVNNLQMCGYCELLTLSPALVLHLLFALALFVGQPRCIGRYVPQAYSCILQPHATPRAPPCLLA